MAYIVVRDHNGRVLQKKTLKHPTVIGRSESCSIRVSDTQVSREHCDLTPSPDGTWVLRDRASRNGTTLNGKPIHERTLRDGDTITVGPARITYFSTPPRRNRAPDPHFAGLIDAESACNSSSCTTPALEPSESSLFATRVMVAPSDESTVAGAQSVPQNPIFSPQFPSAIHQNSPVPPPKYTWASLAGALGLIAASAAIWLYTY